MQVLLPATFPRLYGCFRSPARIVSCSVVIFGHVWKSPLRWSLTKYIPPDEGSPDLSSVDDVAGLMSDSGIGTGVKSSDEGPSPSSGSFYGLRSNTGFLHRSRSQSSWEADPDGFGRAGSKRLADMSRRRGTGSRGRGLLIRLRPIRTIRRGR